MNSCWYEVYVSRAQTLDMTKLLLFGLVLLQDEDKEMISKECDLGIVCSIVAVQ